MQKNRPLRFSIAQSCVAVFLFTGVAANAAPLLRCEVTYAGATQVIETTPVEDAYEVKPVDIAGRFLFKVVMSAPKGKLVAAWCRGRGPRLQHSLVPAPHLSKGRGMAARLQAAHTGFGRRGAVNGAKANMQVGGKRLPPAAPPAKR